MRKLTLLLGFSIFILSACFRNAGSDTPTAQPISIANADFSAMQQVDTQPASETPTEEISVLETTDETPVAAAATATETAVIVTETLTETPTDIPSPTFTATATEDVLLGQGGSLLVTEDVEPTAEEALPLGEIPTQEAFLSSPTAVDTNTPLPSNTPLPTNTGLPSNTPLPTNTPLPSNTPLPTNTGLPSSTPLPTETPTSTVTSTATATPTVTNTLPGAAVLPTLTTVPLVLNNNNQPTGGALGQPSTDAVIANRPTATTVPLQEVAQIPTATLPIVQPTIDPNTGLTINQLTATAVIAGATATTNAQNIQGTIAAGGDPNQFLQLTPQQGVPVNPQQQPGAQVIVVTSTPISQDCEYYVNLGDNLGSIARNYNLTIEEIALANNIINPDLIEAGYYIIIPRCGGSLSPTATPTAADPAAFNAGQPQTVQPTNNATGPFTYTVQTGDRIYQLAVLYGVTVREVLAANPQVTDMNVIYEGQQITIPGPPSQIPQQPTLAVPAGNVIIVTATPLGGVVDPNLQQQQVLPPTAVIPVGFTPTWTPIGQ